MDVLTVHRDILDRAILQKGGWPAAMEEVKADTTNLTKEGLAKTDHWPEFFRVKVLEFYKWEGEVKDHMKATVAKVDELASTWSEQEKQACLDETAMSFRYSGALMVYLRPPSPELKNEINV